MDYCALLAQVIPVLEKLAPMTKIKLDDMLLMGMQMAQSALCEKDAVFSAPADADPEVVAGAEEWCVAFIAACDDEGCDDGKCGG